MKKLLLTILALIVLSSVLVGCTKQQGPAPADVSTTDIDQATQEIDAALDSDMTELNTLDADLTELETMDLE
jgi:predicted small lipoprotein YifL